MLVNKATSDEEPDNVVVEYKVYNDPSRFGFKPSTISFRFQQLNFVRTPTWFRMKDGKMKVSIHT